MENLHREVKLKTDAVVTSTVSRLRTYMQQSTRAASQTNHDSNRDKFHRKQTMKSLRLLILIGSAVLFASPAAGTYAADHSMMHSSSTAVRTNAHAPMRTDLFISPGIVNVGQRVTLSVIAPVPSTVHISFQSLHHSFTGAAVYQRSSRSYVESVYLLPRMHATERAQVVASITPRRPGRPYRLYGQFLIRGGSMSMNGIPQNNGGDGDADNNGAPSDGDGD